MNIPSSSRKTTKSSNTNVKKTLDIQHSNKVSQIQDLEQKHDELKQRLKQIINQLDELIKLKRTVGLTDKEFDDYIRFIDERDDLQKDIDGVVEQMNEIDYYVNTAPILFKYYDIIEKGGGDEDMVNKVDVGENSILKFFIKQPEEEEEKKDNKDDRASLLDKYLMMTDENHVVNVPQETKDCCKHCGSSNMFMLPNDGINYCNDCYSMEYVTIDHDKPSYKDPPLEVTYFCYKRINHLNECISQIQGKETTDIPAEVYDMILLEIKKQKITNMADLTPKKLRGILKKLKLNRYYEHLVHLLSKLTGMDIPHLDPEVEERIRVMFKLIQPAFLKHAPKSRKNFLSYNYVLSKFVQLLERDEYMHLFPSLKSRMKVADQDKVWAKICAELNWQFIPSL
jgi:hypothetical protein